MRLALIALLLVGCQSVAPLPVEPPIVDSRLRLCYFYAAAAITANKPIAAEASPRNQDILPAVDDQPKQLPATPVEPGSVSEVAEPGPTEGVAAAIGLPNPKLVIFTQPNNCAPCWRLEQDIRSNAELSDYLSKHCDVEFRQPLPSMEEIPYVRFVGGRSIAGYSSAADLLAWLRENNPNQEADK